MTYKKSIYLLKVPTSAPELNNFTNCAKYTKRQTNLRKSYSKNSFTNSSVYIRLNSQFILLKIKSALILKIFYI
jgi:hypothetical protein